MFHTIQRRRLGDQGLPSSTNNYTSCEEYRRFTPELKFKTRVLLAQTLLLGYTFSMSRHIATAEDLAWLLMHTRGFQGGHVSDMHVHKQRLFDDALGREISAGTTIIATIRYDLAVREADGLLAMTRVAKLTMRGVSDFSLFEQDGGDFSEIQQLHAEASEGRLRFWFDPGGELYVICDEAELEEVSRPMDGKLTRAAMTHWTFQAKAGYATASDVPTVSWILAHLDRMNSPCTWKPARNGSGSHPALRWEGYLVPAFLARDERTTGLLVQVYGPLDGAPFGVTLRILDLQEESTAHLLIVLADIIAQTFRGTCVAGTQVMEREEWLNRPSLRV
jgi:hypothetical protein